MTELRQILPALLILLLLAGCASGPRGEAPGGAGTGEPPKAKTDAPAPYAPVIRPEPLPKAEPLPPSGPLSITGTLLDGEFVEENRLVRAGRSVVRIAFSHPVDPQSLGRIRTEGTAPVRQEWEAGHRALRYTLDLKHGEWTGITLEEVRAEGGGTFPRLYYSLKAVGRAGLWRLDPGGEPTRMALVDDRFESLWVSPNGEALALYEVAEVGYMDFLQVWMGNPATGAIRKAEVPVRDMQAAGAPRWWSGGALFAGISWGVNKVDWQGKNLGGIPTVESGKGLAVRGTGIAPDGTPAILVSGWPNRENQPPVDLLVGGRRLPGVSQLPLWPKSRGDTHYWPHVQIHWISPDQVILLDLDTHFTGGNQWRRVTLSTGEIQPYPVLNGWSRAYPDPKARRFLVWTYGKGWHLLKEGVALRLDLKEGPEVVRTEPVWSQDGKRVFLGPFDISTETGAVQRLKAVPDGTRRVARDSSGRVWWLQLQESP